MTEKSEHKIITATAPFRTRKYGNFQIMTTDPAKTDGQHIILAKGNVADTSNVLCRVASACVTSTAFDAEDCDCSGQLHAALTMLSQSKNGLLIYLNQEGRGYGLTVKVQAMNGKSNGLDTFEAVEQLGLEPDVRKYSMVGEILAELQVKSVWLLTNNPEKANSIREAGVEVAGISPCLAPEPPAGALRHLEAKRRRGHSF